MLFDIPCCSIYRAVRYTVLFDIPCCSIYRARFPDKPGKWRLYCIWKMEPYCVLYRGRQQKTKCCCQVLALTISIKYPARHVNHSVEYSELCYAYFSVLHMLWHNLLNKTRYTPRYTCYTPRYTCYTPRYTCYTTRYTCYTPRSTCYTPCYTCYTPCYTCYTPRSTCYTPRSTCYTPRSTPCLEVAEWYLNCSSPIVLRWTLCTYFIIIHAIYMYMISSFGALLCVLQNHFCE